MPYTIFRHDQITPRTVQRGDDVRENPARAALPAGTSIFYQPSDYDRFSDNPEQRMLLLSDPDGTATETEIMAAFPAINDAKYAALWQSAHEYEQRFISGVALALLSIGVAQGKPKCLAFAAWSNRLWNDTYYPRKAAIRFDTAPDCDFSSVGEPPYTVPELSAEVWG